MNKQERLAIWQDETAHPGSPTTWVALATSGANLHLMEEWRDLEGDTGESTWMTYMSFLEGKIGQAVDFTPEEMMSPPNWSRFHVDMSDLWDELTKVTDEFYDENGATHHDRVHYALMRREADADYIEERFNRQAGVMTPVELRALAAAHDRQDIARKATPPEQPKPLTIVEVPGTFYARYDSEGKIILGFGFMPPNTARPEFRVLDGPAPDESINEYISPFWEALRVYLGNVEQISGEAAMAVVWEEDGWDTRCTGS